MELINEQEEYNRLTRDLICPDRTAPVSVTDQVPSVMIPQWHRGTMGCPGSASSTKK